MNQARNNGTSLRAHLMASAAGLAVTAGAAQAQIYQLINGGQPTEHHYSITEATEGGTTTAGMYRFAPAGPSFGRVIRHDVDGSTIWERVFGGTAGNDVGYSVIETSDGGFVVAYETTSTPAAFGVAMIKFDATGAPLWTYAYPGTAFSDPFLSPNPGVQVVEDPKNGDLVVQHNFSGLPALLRTDAAGIPIWQRAYFPSTGFPDTRLRVTLTDLKIDAEGTIYASGTALTDFLQQGPAPDQDPYLMRVAGGTGAPLFSQIYKAFIPGADIPTRDSADGLDIRDDGRIVLSGRTDLPFTAGTENLLVFTTDAGGAPIWSLSYLGFAPDGTGVDLIDGYAAVREDESRRSIIIAGWRETTDPATGAASTLAQMTRLRSFDGSFDWHYSYGDSANPDELQRNTRFESVVEQPQYCGYTATGVYHSGPNDPAPFQNGDQYLVAVNELGTSGCREKQHPLEPVTFGFEPVQVQLDPQELQEFIQLPFDVFDPQSRWDWFCLDTDCAQGPNPCNSADLAAPFGTLNFADVQAFLVAFGAMQPSADIAPPFGVWNFADVQAFLAAFGQGC